MKKFVASSINKALKEASRYFNCSLTQIEYEVVQSDSNGFLGLFKKEAIIIASKKHGKSNNPHIEQSGITTSDSKIHIDTKESKIISNSYMQDLEQPSTQDQQRIQQDSVITGDIKECPPSQDTESYEDKTAKNADNDTYNKQNFTAHNDTQNDKDELLSYSTINTHRAYIDNEEHNETGHLHNNSKHTNISYSTECDLDTSFYSKKENIDKNHSPECKTVNDICCEVQQGIRELFDYLPFNIHTINVAPYDERTLFIFLDGDDCALLIGQKGYRYKSLSYLLFNWINDSYGYGVRLEIAEFLKNQEIKLRAQLKPIIERALHEDVVQTETFDGIASHIAIGILRQELKNKYIVFKNEDNGNRYILIANFFSSAKHTPNMKGFGDIPKY